ncbi:PQQ-dependent sugar dehydrogenase [Jiulongibacter sediminis]|uniref:PQQ-dependent sugar dehydrogenase n=1 Tax=Jiulongibacter sediminis TaxID=1605367 RepID=UPI0026E91D83|nr:PQQ-dependent sugar dehydrogenase [Jiulongibacter sediminis]
MNSVKLLLTLCLLVFCVGVVLAQKPDESRFSVKKLATDFDEPMELTFIPGGKVLFIERKGALKLYNPALEDVFTVGIIDCNTKYVNAEGKEREAEEGLMGIVADPNFEENHWLYLFYSHPSEPKHMLTRWDFVDDQLVEGSEKVILEFPVQRQECCHTGGGMVFDPSGNLYLTVGNNTSNGGSGGYAPLDERPGREPWDDQRGAGNTNDLRGSVLRIKPMSDGSYEIPEGNLFTPGTPKTKPEIYTKGSRNPWRPAIDSHTGYLYWGEVGPDAPKSTEMGPAGYDEFNQAKKAGFFGWPYFAGNNEPYRDLNFETKEKGELFSLEGSLNNSPNNTGLKKLPPPTPAFIWYPYDISEKFPLLGVSGRSATGVAVYHQDDFDKEARLWPDYYEGKLLIADFMRGWIMSVTMDENSDYVSMERFLPKENFSSLIDMAFGPDGDLYFLKYGTNWFGAAENSGLFKIEYNAGNRPPVVKLQADRQNGALPLEVNFSSVGSFDPDGDDIINHWKISLEGKEVKSRTGEMDEMNYQFTKPGVYKVQLEVEDSHGVLTTEQLDIKAGNTAPEVKIEILEGNKSFYFPDEKVKYEVLVKDAEDGSLDFSEILPSQVAVNIDYMPETFDPIEISSNYATADIRARFNTGYKLISKSDCGSCHLPKEKSIGPSYEQVAERYQSQAGATQKLAAKVISGGQGVWGDHAMAAHPQLSESDAEAMVRYILSFSEPELEEVSAPISGEFETKIPNFESGFGGYVIRAAYTDEGAKKVPSISTESISFLKYPFLDPQKHDFSKNTENVDTPTHVLQFFGDQSFIGFEGIDLSGIGSVDLLVQASNRTSSAGGILEIRVDNPEGRKIGEAEIRQIDVGEDVEGIGKEPHRKIYQEQLQRMEVGAAEYFQGRSQVINVPIQQVKGVYDLYFVPKSPKAKFNQNVFSFSGIELRPE